MHPTVQTAAPRTRLSLFDIPHKGIRNALGQLSLLAGQADYTDPSAVARLYRLGRQVFRLLTLHARDENEVIFHHLDQRRPEATLHPREEHESLESLQQHLEELLDELSKQVARGENATAAGARFYELVSELHAHHLEHMLEEERDTQPLLWQHFTDEELLAQRGMIIGRNRPEDLLLFYRFVFPAQSSQERIALLRALKANAPAPFFQAIMEVLKEVLPADAFGPAMAALA